MGRAFAPRVRNPSAYITRALKSKLRDETLKNWKSEGDDDEWWGSTSEVAQDKEKLDEEEGKGEEPEVEKGKGEEPEEEEEKGEEPEKEEGKGEEPEEEEGNMRSLKRKRQKKSAPQKAAPTRALMSSGDDLHKRSERRVGNPEGL